ncbi:MAG: LapA family protein [Deltaproteobacteria bacterium]|nr:LapA family protein [Deltaproteobacteria bacterium]
MKTFKRIVLALVIIFLVVVVWQNKAFFTQPESVKLNLQVWSTKTPAIPLYVYFLAFFFIGLLISYFYALTERFKARKVIKGHLETIQKLEEQVKVLKSLTVAEQAGPPKEGEAATPISPESS